MSELTIKNLIIGIIIFGIMMGGIVTILSSISDTMLGNRTSEFNETFYVLDNINSEVASLQEDVGATSGEDRGEAGWWDIVFKRTWVSIKTVFSSFSFFTNAIEDIANWLEIPSFFLIGITALISVIVIFGIIKAVTKSDI